MPNSNDFDPPYPQDWQVGDAVYCRYFRADTGRYFIRGEGRVVAIEGNELVLATRTKGTIRHSRFTWPAWKSRAEGEAWIAKDPSPGGSRPMAHHGPDFECLYCEQLRLDLPPTVPEHSPRCAKRDPAVKS